MDNCPEELVVKWVNGSLTDEEAMELASWVRRSPSHASQFRRMSARLTEEEGRTTAGAAAFWDRFPKRARMRRAARVGAVLLTAAAALAAFLFLRPVSSDPSPLMETGGLEAQAGMAAPSVAPVPEPEVFRAPADARRELRLADGSRIVLNRGASLTVRPDFGKGCRDVELDGEAWFDVTRDPSRPFRIHCGKETYVVRGTTFNILSWASDGYSVVTLHSGSLEAHVREDRILLKPGDELTVDHASEEVARRHVDVSGSTRWMESGTLVFHDVSLRQVALRISHRYGVRINVHASVEHIRYDGQIDDESLDTALYLLSVSSPVPLSVTEFDGEYYISKKN